MKMARSTGPSVSSMRLPVVSQALSSVTSSRKAVIWPGTSAARESRSRAVRALAATVHPSCASRLARARPIPVPAPVTHATPLFDAGICISSVAVDTTERAEEFNRIEELRLPVPHGAVLQTVHVEVAPLVGVFGCSSLVDRDAVAWSLAGVQVAVAEFPVPVEDFRRLGRMGGVFLVAEVGHPAAEMQGRAHRDGRDVGGAMTAGAHLLQRRE